MAHPEQVTFCKSVQALHPSFFSNRLVLDIGSLDINGNNHYLFDNCMYIGVDLKPGKNVDIVSKGHELKFPDESFDLIISTECFEHDYYYKKTLPNILRMIKPGGMFMFSCATTGRPEHGTRMTTPEDAPFMSDFGEWGDYYKNLDENDIREVIDIEKIFEIFNFSINKNSHDIYFWEIKKGTLLLRNDYSFQVRGDALQKERDELQEELNKIYNSNGWRWLDRYYTLRSKISPK